MKTAILARYSRAGWVCGLTGVTIVVLLCQVRQQSSSRPEPTVEGISSDDRYITQLAQQAQTQPAQPAQLRDAFPLIHGRRWTYQTKDLRPLYLETTAGRELDGVATTSLRATGDSFFWASELFLADHDGELRQHGTAYGTSTFVDQPPLVLLRRDLSPSMTWTSESRSLEGNSRFQFAATVVGKETITVPAGQFSAWKIEYVLGWHLGTEDDLRVWYVPGVGVIKLEKWQKSTLGQKTKLDSPVSYELTRIESLQGAHPIHFPSASQSVTALPPHVVAPDQQVTLFADYSDVWNNQVVLYLINRTATAIDVPSQDGDIFAKLETQLADGSWARAQPHTYSWCGNSYFSRQVGSGKFIQVLGWMAPEGDDAVVRYRIYGDLSIASNQGTGRVSRAEFEAAQYDVMSARQGNVDLVRRILLERRDLPDAVRASARSRLRKLPGEEVLPIVRQVLRDAEIGSDDWTESLKALSHFAPAEFLEYALEAFRTNRVDACAHLLDLRGSLSKCDDGRLHHLFVAMASDPQNVHLRRLLTYFGQRRTPEAEALLTSISHDMSYSDELRIAARYELEQWFGDDIVEIALQVSGNYGEQRLPVPMVITLRNKTANPLPVRYDKPSDIVALYLTVESAKPRPKAKTEFLVPRAEVKWFARHEGPWKVSLELQPGESHQLTMNLADYYDIPRDYEPKTWSLVVWPSCAIPGAHRIAQSSGGSGISIGSPY